MAWTASLDVSVGDATKETDYDQLVANVEYLQTLADAEHNFHISSGTGYHKAMTVAGTMTVGVNDAGYDVKFYGDTADKSMLWDTSADKLIITGDVQCTGTATGFGSGAFSENLTIANTYGLVVGGTAQQTISDGGGATDVVPEVQVLGTATADMTALIGGWSTTATRAAAPTLALLKSGNATIASHTVVTDDEILGSIIAYGDDGTDYESPAAAIEFAVDGTPGTGDMPGRVVFYTSVDGGEVLTERMRIDSSGAVTKPTHPAFQVYQAAAANNVTGDGTLYTTTWDTEIYDQGADFASNTFTAPIDGRYLLTVKVSTSGSTTSHTDGRLEIVTSNGTYRTRYNAATWVETNTMTTASVTIIADMDAADTATVALQLTGSTKVVDIAVGKEGGHFTGALLA